MGQKVHPHGFRLGYIYTWNSKWYADKNYTEQLHEDLRIRRSIERMLPDAGISRVEINEVRLPEIEAPLVARAVAEQIERRVSHRRAIKQAALRAMQRGAQGVRIKISGRLGGSDMSRKDQERQGRVPLHTLKADVDYGTSEARTTLGRIGVKVWIYKGDIISERTPPPVSALEKARAASGEPQAGGVAAPGGPDQPSEASAEAAAAEPPPEPAQRESGDATA